MKLSAIERHVFNKLRAMAAGYVWDCAPTLECGTDLMQMEDTQDVNYNQMRHERKRLFAYIESFGFTVLGNGCFSLVMSHPKVHGKVFKWNPTNDDNSFTFVAQMTILRHERLPTYYAVEGGLSGYVAILEELDENSGWDEESVKYDNGGEDWDNVVSFLKKMGMYANDVSEANIMMRGNDVNAWVLSDPTTRHLELF